MLTGIALDGVLYQSVFGSELADLKAEKPGQIAIGYKDVSGGAELTYRPSDTKLAAALRQWSDGQLLDRRASSQKLLDPKLNSR